MIPIDSCQFGCLLARIARRVTSCGQFNHRFWIRRLLVYTIFFTRPLPHLPRCVLKKKGIFYLFPSFLRFSARFPSPFFSSGWGMSRPFSEPRPVGVSVRFSPVCGSVLGVRTPIFVRAENSTACAVSASAPVVSGGGLVHSAGVNCHYHSDPATPGFLQV